MIHPNSIYRGIISIWLTLFLLGLSTGVAFPQDKRVDIDIRLTEVVQKVKEISKSGNSSAFSSSSLPLESGLSTDNHLDLLIKINRAVVRHESVSIRSALEDLATKYNSEPLDGVIKLYLEHAHLLEINADWQSYLDNIDRTVENGNWLEKFSGLMLAEALHSEKGERNAALQKAQLAFSIIPQGENASPYTAYAMSEITQTLAKLYNIQGNVDLALDASLA